MPPKRKTAAAAAAPAAVIATDVPAAGSAPPSPVDLPMEQLNLQPTPPTNGRKRSASPPPTQPTTDDSSELSSQATEETAGSSKRRRTVKKEKSEPVVGNRVSKRKATKESSKASIMKAGGIPTKGGKIKATKAAGPKAPKKPKEPKPPVNGIPEHFRPARQLLVFGAGNMGQFGLGTETTGEIKRPRLHAWCEVALKEGTLGTEPGAGLEKVAVGGMHNLLVDEQGHVWSWGVNDGAALGRRTAGVIDPETNEKIENDELESTPMKIQSLIDQEFRAVLVAAGDSVSIAISDTGKLRAWGSFRSNEGILGFDGKKGSEKLRFDPMALEDLSKERFVQAACGSDHVVALTTEGKVWVWGDPRQGALGRKVLERHITHGLRPGGLPFKDKGKEKEKSKGEDEEEKEKEERHKNKVVHVASGNWHSFAICEDGTVYGWGLNSYGQLGLSDPDTYFDPETTDTDRKLVPTIEVPQEIVALRPEHLGEGRRVKAISGGEHHTLFLLSDGSVYACGRHDLAQLGIADDHPASIALAEFKKSHEDAPACIPYPVQVYFPPAPNPDNTDPPLGTHAEASAAASHRFIAQISAGSRHNLAVSEDGIVYGWGYGAESQLGMGDVDEQTVPARVKSKVIAEFEIEEAHAGGQHCLLVARRLEHTGSQ